MLNFAMGADGNRMLNYGDGGKQFPDVPEFRDFGGGGGAHTYRGQQGGYDSSGINPSGMYTGGNMLAAQLPQMNTGGQMLPQPYGAPVQQDGSASYPLEQMPQFSMGGSAQQSPQIAGSFNAMMQQGSPANSARGSGYNTGYGTGTIQANQWPSAMNQSSYGNMTGQSQQPMNQWAQRGFGV